MRLPAILSGCRLRLWFQLVLNGLCQAVATVGTAWLIRMTFDRVLTAVPPASWSRLLWVGLALVAAAGGMAWLRLQERVDAERLGQNYAHEIRVRLFDHLSALSPRVLQRRSRGGVMLRFVGDLVALSRWVSRGLARLVVSGLTVLSTLVALAMINGSLALAVAGVLLPGGLLTLGLRKGMRAAFMEARRRRSSLAANVDDKIAAIAVVQVCGQTAREQQRLARQSQRLQEAMVAPAVLLLGVAEVAAGRATPGMVVAAMTVVGLLAPALRDLGRAHEYWHGAQVARQKIREFLDTPPLVTELLRAPDLQPGAGRLEFVGVRLAGAIHEVTAVAYPGTVVALVGPPGAGKSTLLALAARLIDPDAGQILLDGYDLAAHNLASVRRVIGMVSPDLPLLRGSVEKNLRYRWPDAPPEEIARVKALCQLDEILAELPDSAQTRVLEGGSNLPTGQRQRIALARALLGNPAVLLLDEPDANLDTAASTVLDCILTAYHGTVLLVTHHPERLALADAIWHLEHGRLVEVRA